MEKNKNEKQKEGVTPTDEQSEKEIKPKVPRDSIALFITLTIVLITVILGLMSVIISIKDHKADFSLITDTLLPLWGTWIGTVLAFYFGKANFEAGTRSYQDAIKASLTPEEKIAKMLVKDVMLPEKSIEFLKLEEEQSKPLSAILAYERFKPYNRFAVIDAGKVVKYMLHRGLIYQFIYEYNAQNKVTDNTDKPLLSDLLNSTDDRFRKPLTRGIGYVALDANLLDAKRVMDATEECLDVFVTQTNKSTEPVLGLLTNNRIFEYAKV